MKEDVDLSLLRGCGRLGRDGMEEGSEEGSGNSYCPYIYVCFMGLETMGFGGKRGKGGGGRCLLSSFVLSFL